MDGEKTGGSGKRLPGRRRLVREAAGELGEDIEYAGQIRLFNDRGRSGSDRVVLGPERDPDAAAPEHPDVDLGIADGRGLVGREAELSLQHREDLLLPVDRDPDDPLAGEPSVS